MQVLTVHSKLLLYSRRVLILEALLDTSMKYLHFTKMIRNTVEELDGPSVSALRRAIAEVQQHWSVIGWVTKIYYLNLLRASEGTLIR
jgi:hypothetical protein